MATPLFKYSKFIKEQNGVIRRYHAAHNKIIKNITQSATLSQLNKLENTLNLIVNTDNFNNIIETELLPKLPQTIGKSIENLSIGTKTNNNAFKITNTDLSAAWREYNQKKAKYDSLGIELTEIDKKKLEDALKTALSINGSMNSIRGQIFESFLQMVIPIISTVGFDEIDTIINQLVENLKNSKAAISTMGSTKDKISLQLGDKMMQIASQGKIDVSVPSPFTTNENIKSLISAKNYSSTRDIHIFSGAVVVGLMSQWPVSEHDINYGHYGLAVYTPQPALLNEMKSLMAIQGLAGSQVQNSDKLANIFILNTQSKKNPIKVISIPILLDAIFNKTTDDNALTYFEILFDKQLQLFSYNEEHDGDNISLYDNDDMIDRLSNLHVNITLKSNIIKQYQSLLKK